jgi:type VII secretion protein EccE
MPFTATVHGTFRFPFKAGQVILWQVAALAVLAAVPPLNAVGIAVLVLAVLAVAVTSVRVGGLCGYEWAAYSFRYLRRKAGGFAETPLRALWPELHVHTHVDRAGNRVGIVSVGKEACYSAVLRVVPPRGMAPQALVSVLREAFARTDIRLTSAQLVVWAMPQVPAPVRVHWLALHYRAEDMPAAAQARGGGEVGARKATAAAALRLAGSLSGIGCATTVLDTLELYRELLVALGSSPDAHGPHRAVETWRDFTVGRQRQVSFVPGERVDPAAVLGRCLPWAAFTCTSYTVDRTALGRVRARAVVRVGLRPGVSTPSPASASVGLGVRLVGVNGRQGEHVLSTVPLALAR